MFCKSRNVLFVSITSTILIGFVMISFIKKNYKTESIEKKEIVDSFKTINVIVAGDAMAHYPQITSAYDKINNNYNFYPVFQYIAPIIKKFDFSIVNYETTAGGKPYTGYPQFSAPDTLAYVIKEAGFKFFVNANNHSVDRGLNGIVKTIDVFNKYLISHTGTFKNSEIRNSEYPSIQYIKGFKLAILNYTYGTNGLLVPEPAIVNIIDTNIIKMDLKKALDSIPDAVIVCMHWGIEYQREPNQEQKDLTKFLFENGADVVVGSHPHVIQPIELMSFNYHNKNKQGLVIWSLGNFVSNQRKPYTNGGIMVDFTLEKNLFTNSLKIKEIGYIPVWVYKSEKPEQFFILPIHSFEKDTSTFNFNTTDESAFRTFINDTRSHLKRDTVNIKEHFILN